MTQQYLNDDVSEKYNKSWNSAREETLPNTTLENLYVICSYFEIEIDNFFKIVKNITDEEIDEAIKSKKKLSTIYKNI